MQDVTLDQLVELCTKPTAYMNIVEIMDQLFPYIPTQSEFNKVFKALNLDNICYLYIVEESDKFTIPSVRLTAGHFESDEPKLDPDRKDPHIFFIEREGKIPVLDVITNALYKTNQKATNLSTALTQIDKAKTY